MKNTSYSKYTLQQKITLSVISMMLLMDNIDANILGTAIPTIATSLSVSVLNLKLAVTSYLIGLAIFIPIGGFVSDRFGTKKVLLCSVFFFVFFSIWCGAATNLWTLVIARFCQGIAGAFMAPVGRLLLLKAFDKADIVKVYTIMAMPVILGPLLAPFIGGVLIQWLDWRYIFWVNIPMGIIGMILTYRYIENYTGDTIKFNWASFIFLGLFLAMSSLFLDVLFFPLSITMKISLLIISAILVFVYYKIEFSSENKIVDYNLFKLKIFNLCFWGNFITRMAFGGRNFALALYLQVCLGLTPLHASYLLSCLAPGLFIGRALINRLLPVFGFKRLMITANLGVVITTVMLSLITKIDVLAITIVVFNGIFSSISYMLLNVLTFAEITEADYANASSITNTVQQLSISVGVVVCAMLLHTFNSVFVEFDHKVFYLTFISLAIIGISCQLLLQKLNRNDGIELIKR